MNKLIKYQKAKDEIARLQKYVDLVDSYNVDCLEKRIIKEYAITNSLNKVVENLNHEHYPNKEIKINKDYVRSVINGEVIDELHKTLKKGYLYKIRSNKKIIYHKE